MIVSKRNTLTFSTGRSINCNCGIVGINAMLEVSEGYDGELRPDFDDEPWTPAEKAELADYMIGLWTQFREQANP